MTETRQFIIFLLCVVNLMVSVWVLTEVVGIRWAVEGMR